MSPEKNAFIIPIHIEHLVVSTAKSEYDMAGQLADFSLMPHYAKGEESCALPRLRPNIAEDFVSKPFEATNDPLYGGIHLHWSLPRDFKRAVILDGEAGEGSPTPRYRPIPNRWLIERRVYDNNAGVKINGKEVLTRKWILESDALQSSKQNGSCAFPLDPDKYPQNGGPQYRYLGKLYDLDEWLEKEKNGNDKTQYLDELTAFGYGEPLFPGYYPECRNVLGFHDDLQYRFKGETYKKEEGYSNDAFTELVGTYNYEFRYIITGWYSKPWQDPFARAKFKPWDKLKVSDEEDRHELILDALKESELNAIKKGFLPEIHHLGNQTKVEKLNCLVFDMKEDDIGNTSLSQRTVYGKVLGESTGQALPKAYVIWKGTNNGTVTDYDGAFAITGVSKGSILIFKCEGYKPLEITVGDKSEINVELELLESDTLIESDISTGRALLMGRIGKIFWQREDDDSTSQDKDDNKTDLKVVLANTPGQALAALLASGDPLEKRHHVERVLDALQLGLFAEEDKLDFPARLESALHEAGFKASPGERRWSITLNRDGNYPEEKESEAPRVTQDWALKLQSLNELQQQSDKKLFWLHEKQKQLYADWYKFLLAEYDFTLDEITAEAQVNNIREFVADNVFTLKSTIDALDSSKADIKQMALELRANIDAWNRENKHRKVQFELNLQPGTRYWEPLEPVLLFKGEEIVPSKLSGKADQMTVVGFFPDFFSDTSSEDLVNQVKNFIDNHNLFKARKWLFGSIFLDLLGGNPNSWNPVYMDWEVELFPFTKPADKDFQQKDWPSDSMVANYDLHDGKPDLRVQDSSVTADESAGYKDWVNNNDVQQLAGKRLQTIQGRTFLSPNAHVPFVEQLQEQLKKSGKENQALIDNLKNQKILSQSMSGFNDALIMRKRILQMDVFDPLARTPILKEFTEKVRSVVGTNNAIAPLPSNLFLPLREGPFQIRKIRLVDNWGRGKVFQLGGDTPDGKIIIADPMLPPDTVFPRKANMAYLPPRIVQPCRLNFRWLSATEPGAEAGSHVGNSPVCGYLLPNFLDSSIHVFDANGNGLCVLSRSAKKLVRNPFPGDLKVKPIGDPHLDNFLKSIESNTDKEKQIKFLDDFLKAARESSGVNLPENYAQFDGMSLLVGRPFVLIRAKLNLEIKGAAAVNNSWNARETEYAKQEHSVSTSMGFDKLRFAVRLGDKFRATDGFFAYYIDKGDAKFQELYSPYAENSGSKEDTHAEEYWHKQAILKRWHNIYSERRNMRTADKEEFEALSRGYKKQLLRVISEVTNTTGRPIPKKLGTSLQNLKQAALEANKYEIISFSEPEDDLLKSDHLPDEEKVELKELLEQHNTAIEQINKLEEALEILNKDLTSNQDEIRELQLAHGYKHSGLGLYRPHNDLLTLSLEEDELHLGILMDPRAAVHLHTGILPVKRVDIPPALFAEALNNIQIAFLTTPVISPEPLTEWKDTNGQPQTVNQKFLLQAPLQKGYEWSWLQPGDPNDIPAEQVDTQPPAGYLPILGNQVIYDGWMRMSLKKESKDSTEQKKTKK
ncbi:MAG: carboxypeptidase-like regulatory domain-containing protein [Lewinellaceae bacterium]|nr:carboxypeptidase-like regulatory domain-containing protein [Saprospiraceae bacterium]MCB9342996.1 carboxypeptidase-like regulatory domain-containing protein [Lewinellaceae bacterium]